MNVRVLFNAMISNLPACQELLDIRLFTIQILPISTTIYSMGKYYLHYEYLRNIALNYVLWLMCNIFEVGNYFLCFRLI